MLNWSQSSSSGPSILFLHAAGFDQRMWQETIGLLPDFRCITMDLPGHGLSKATALKTFAQAADKVALTIRAIGEGPVHVAGVSMGAYIGFQYLLRHPDLARTAVLSGFQHQPIQIPRAASIMMDASSWLMGLKTIREKMARSMGIQDVNLISALDGSANCTAKTTRLASRLALNFDAEAALPKVTAKTLVLAGAKEHSAIKESLSAFSGLPNGAARIVPDLGHGWIGQAPDLFADTLRAWIEDSQLPQRLVSQNQT
ncbi:alpha/beta hydrolase [Roseibium polysiphoniae]|uniref:Alpha/beta hydrolase n=1 Tax=Roseibium polysiphoniae TaxID=2571221 RepID=A0A944GTN8_9HYPH|nr:alpha/beta hydrolase [Roseibium polysiphoniae]MBS8261699.1 alpha/beta hydrolase [Roseibium polysiphoniae]